MEYKRFAAEQLPGNHPVIKAGGRAMAAQFGGEGRNTARPVDHEVVDYAAAHPLRRSVCYATREHAQAIARHFNAPADPWAAFLSARADCIAYFHREGHSDQRIAEELSMDTRQVYMIRTHR